MLRNASWRVTLINKGASRRLGQTRVMCSETSFGLTNDFTLSERDQDCSIVFPRAERASADRCRGRAVEHLGDAAHRFRAYHPATP